ncbi:hypothetical protein [Aporhodopirellula aestuarii]|uniref:Secreted protein n=1 Tax=Aporhodopirellula aestuarii TaxID=2950107 RepID=A0ABT0UFN6_9BACT|nr:hypothetical protein [Aporhodopirellula aestuarii]MCM2374921.1 hypothetical protein [Aporhodopirellula aestuarii]
MSNRKFGQWGRKYRTGRRAMLLAAILATPATVTSALGGDGVWVGDCPAPVVVDPCNPHVWNGSPIQGHPSYGTQAPQAYGPSGPSQFDPPVTSPNAVADPFTDDAAGTPGAPSTTPGAAPSTAPGDAPVADPFANANQNAAPTSPSTNFDNISSSDLTSSFASTQSSFSAAPTIIGDFQGGGLSQITATITAPFSFHATGTRGALPTYDRIGGGGFNPDVFAVSGTGQSIGGSAFTNHFEIAEPIPPTDANLAPGPGFSFQGGTATYTDTNATQTPSTNDYTNIANGDQWFIEYEYQQLIGGSDESNRPAPGPGVSVRRVKISENFSPEVRDRGFVNYSFFNDAFGGLGDISRFIAGLEKVLIEDLVSVELRLPVAATYGSDQNLSRPEDRDMEIGNFTIITKLALLRTDKVLWAGGLGIGTPTADDTRISRSGNDLIEIRNESVQIQPFTGVLYRWNDNWSLQGCMQIDIAAGGDPVLVNSNLINPTAGSMDMAGRFRDSTLMHLDVSATRLLYQTRDPQAHLNSLLANAEIHYTSTLEDSDIVSAPNFTYTNLKNQFDIVNATFGTHLVFNNGLILTPAMSVPLRDGLDEQFDYEAILQVNYIR